MKTLSADRVEKHTAPKVLEKIQNDLYMNIDYYAAHPYEIDKRLEQLDQEWDIERAIECLAPSMILLGLGLGTFVNKKWLVLPTVVAGFLLQHGVEGWCPPIPVLRALGFRTVQEIERERYALISLQKSPDFADQILILANSIGATAEA